MQNQDLFHARSIIKDSQCRIRLVQVVVRKKTRVNDNMSIRAQRSPRVSEDW